MVARLEEVIRERGDDLPPDDAPEPAVSPVPAVAGACRPVQSSAAPTSRRNDAASCAADREV